MKKQEADDVKKIETSFLKKHSYFTSWRSGTVTWTKSGVWGEHKSSVSIETQIIDGKGTLRIYYTQTDRDTGEKKDFDYKIPLISTACRYGGRRYWYVCPWYSNGNYCGKRISVLYKGGDYFACRHCYKLTYASRNVNRRYKMFHLFNVLTLQQKIEELDKKVKRPYYRGRPTRKQRQLEKLHAKTGASYKHYVQQERGHLL